MDSLDKRVTEVEYRTNSLALELSSLRSSLFTLENDLRNITDNLNQIKWITVGAVLSFLVGELGVLESLRLLIGS